jgi:hypothetical protein
VAKSTLCVFGVWVFACFCFASHFFAAALSDRWGGTDGTLQLLACRLAGRGKVPIPLDRARSPRVLAWA